MILLTTLGKVIGFLREILLAFYFGASGISDAYLISQTIPGTIFQFVGTGLATCFLPVYLQILSKDNKKKADKFTNTVISLIFIFSTIVIIIVFIFTPQIVKLFASGFEGETMYYAVLFTKIGIFNLYFSALIYVYNSYLQAHNIFNLTAFATVPNSMMIIVSIILGAKFDLLILPIGSILATLVQLLCLVPAMRKQKFELKLNFDFANDNIKEVYKLMLPVVFGVSINQVNVLIDRTLASKIAVGGISALSYSNSLIMFVQGIFAQSISTVYYPKITQMAEERNMDELKENLKEGLNGMTYLLLPITVGTILLSKSVIKILYGRGAFDTRALELTATALIFYAVGVLGYGFRELLSRVFYAFHETKIPMTNAMIGMFLNIIMNLAFSKRMGIGGLALATSLSSIITSLFLIIQLRSRIGKLYTKKDIFEYVKMIVAAIVMGMVIFMISPILERYFSNLSLFVVMVGIGAISYLILTCILKVKYKIISLDSLKQIGKK